MIFETNRLILREMTPEDLEPLFAVLGDKNIMTHYPYTFDKDRVRNWIRRNRDRYEEDGFGLWAVVLKETGEMIGDCGITMQDIRGQMLPEVGYHIRADLQRKGYATEAAAGCIRWLFENYDFPAVYSYMKYTNIPSQKTAMKTACNFWRNTRTRTIPIPGSTDSEGKTGQMNYASPHAGKAQGSPLPGGC